MPILEKIKNELAAGINQAIGENYVSASDLAAVPEKMKGDLGLPLFALAKKSGKNPAEIGQTISGFLSQNKPDFLDGAETQGPYLNFSLNKKYLAEKVLGEISEAKEKYGQTETEKKEKIVLEFSSINTHKEYHVGHLRCVCYGNAVTKLLLAAGYEAVPISYVNDFGIHVAKTLWNYETYLKENLNGKKIEELPEKERGSLLGKIYSDAAQKEKDNPAVSAAIGEWKKKIEGKKGAAYKLWKKTREWSIALFASIYKDLQIKFKDILYESEFANKGKKAAEKLLQKNIFKKSEGAVIADLREYGLDVLVVIRSNGTATYVVADLALAEAKRKKYHPDKSIYLVDVRQSLYFKQLFKILELTGYQEKLIHLPFDFVKLPSGMMSSRTGNVITYGELKEEIMAKSETETKKRHLTWPEKKIKETAEKIGLGAMKFEMLKVGSNSIITFDIEKALSLEGYTSAYIQYAYARIQSIFRKITNYELRITNLNCEKLSEGREITLIKKMARFPEIIEIAGKNYDPSEIAKYIYELAQMLNDYYHAVPVLKAEEETKNARLALLAAVAQTLKNGLGLLGIETVEEM